MITEQFLLGLSDHIMDSHDIRSSQDIIDLSSKDILTLFSNLPDVLLPIFVSYVKSLGEGSEVFYKLMGDHEEDNRDLVDQFFNRYMNSVINNDEEDINPLLTYLSKESLADLGFVQSRQNFFMGQSIDHINEFIEKMFGYNPNLGLGEQEKGWEILWNEVMK